jgi:hypothetical protein
MHKSLPVFRLVFQVFGWSVSDLGHVILISKKSASNQGQDILPSGKHAPILGEEILTLEKHAPVLGQIIPPWEYRASDFRHTIPTPDKSDPILGEEIPTSENYPSDLGQEIPLSEYLLPDFRQAFGLTRGQALCYLTNTKAFRFCHSISNSRALLIYGHWEESPRLVALTVQILPYNAQAILYCHTYWQVHTFC